MTARWRRIRREWRAHPDRGVSLMELTVVMFVFGLVLVGVVSLTTGIERSDSESAERVTATDEARHAMQQMSRTIRRSVVPSTLGGTGERAVLRAEPNALTLYANLDNPDNTVGPSLVEYVLEGGVLTQTVRRPVAGTRDTYCADDDTTAECEGTVRTVILCRRVLGSVFTYRNAMGLSATSLDEVRVVSISLLVGGDERRSRVRMVDLVVLFSVS